MKTSCTVVMWVVAILACEQFSPTLACSFVKTSGRYNASRKSEQPLKQEEDCFRACYEDAECMYMDYVENGVAGTNLCLTDITEKLMISLLITDHSAVFELNYDADSASQPLQAAIAKRDFAQSSSKEQPNTQPKARVMSFYDSKPKWDHFKGTRTCYKVFTSSQGIKFDEAEKKCARKKGNLATIHSEKHNSFLADLVREKASGHSAMIGLSLGKGSNATDREKKWNDGKSSNYTNWNTGEPNDHGGEDCVVMDSDGKWNDVRCSQPQNGYICQTKNEEYCSQS
ncbi:lectin C-type domain protein [Ancylostoma ceylanicum]|uniref:Lectin C-type domain protein n=1 Tax=Ancylostoma ceylanicum TaxID=53326 RepID=A0A0D6LRN8_9BILA|nr:lectin C-type domain protein [Ancylostoma ceylanicum]